jgi:hypothetical protein
LDAIWDWWHRRRGVEEGSGLFLPQFPCLCVVIHFTMHLCTVAYTASPLARVPFATMYSIVLSLKKVFEVVRFYMNNFWKYCMYIEFWRVSDCRVLSSGVFQCVHTYVATLDSMFVWGICTHFLCRQSWCCDMYETWT